MPPAGQRRGHQFVLVGLDRRHLQGPQIPRGGGQSDDLGGHRGARLETLRRGCVGGGLHGHGLDHRAAGEERRQVGEKGPPAIEHADTGRPQHLVAREGREVDVERVEVHGLMRHRLARVEHGQRTDGLGPRHQLRDRRDRTRDVRMMAERHDFDAFVEFKRIQVDAPIIGDAVPPERRTRAPRQFLPRNQVGVVLEFGGDDDVAGADGPIEPLVPSAYATRLIDSVAFLVNTSSSTSAPTKSAISHRPCS